MRSWILALATIFLAMTSVGLAAQEFDDRPGIAVLPFDVTQLPPADLTGTGLNFGIQQMFVSELQANSALRVIDRRAISAVMQELELHGSGQVDAATASQIGEIVGARYMIGGSYFDNFGTLRLDVRVIDGETTELITTAREQDDSERLFELIGTLASSVTEGLDLPPLPQVVQAERQSWAPPRDAVMLYSLALARDEASEPDQALEHLGQLLDKWPDYGDASALRDDILRRQSG